MHPKSNLFPRSIFESIQPTELLKATETQVTENDNENEIEKRRTTVMLETMTVDHLNQEAEEEEEKKEEEEEEEEEEEVVVEMADGLAEDPGLPEFKVKKNLLEYDLSKFKDKISNKIVKLAEEHNKIKKANAVY